MSLSDPRVQAASAERHTADRALQGQLEGDWTWLTPTPMWCAVGRLSLRAAPDGAAGQVSEALLGEALDCLERLGEWAWIRTRHDGYLGYVRTDGLSDSAPAAPRPVTALRGHLYAEPKVSAPMLDTLSWGARLSVLAQHSVRERLWYEVAHQKGTAFIGAEVLNTPASPDLMAFARRFLETPYRWGGRSAWGLDCSGLSQLAYASVGRAIPRDADQQQAFLTPVDTPEPGDLAFFPGHVGIMLDPRRMLHANATHMAVSIETLGEGEYGRRLQGSLEGFGRWPGGAA